MRKLTTHACVISAALASAVGAQVPTAFAQDAAASGSLSIGSSSSSAHADVGVAAEPAPSAKAAEPTVAAAPVDPLAPPWGSEAGTWEFGLYWGLFIPDADHELYDPDPSRTDLGHHSFESVTPELGVRAAFFPASILGLELEGGLLPTQLGDTNLAANVFALRGHVLLQAPIKAVVPFLALGGGVLAVDSKPEAVGSDLDGALHVGVGVKGYFLRNLALRLDVRDTFSNGFGSDEIAQHWEVVLGVTVVAGRKEPPPDSDGDGYRDPQDACVDRPGTAPNGCPPDRDADGVEDAQDKCVDVAGLAPTGCPPDVDGDGIVDSLDACPNAPGEESTLPAKHGCPPPPPDKDGDGVADAIDACPELVGDGPDGCVLDGDQDGVPDRDDKCSSEAETKNGFEDQDGCPDALPEAVKKFTGVIDGIVFQASKATIRPESFGKLDEAVKVLTEYPALRMEISGHSDTSGNAERNTQLSKERADAVKAYFVSKGIAAERIETLGAGSSMPIGDNATKAGRAKNRRIEFKLLQ